MAIEHDASLLADTTFWVLIAAVIFAFVGYKYGRHTLLKTLDDRTSRIKANIEEAENLRVEAQELLGEYQRKHRDALNEAEDLLKNAQQQAELIEKKAEEQLRVSVKRREEQAKEKIRLAEEAALEEVRNKVVDIATAAASDLLKKSNEGKSGEKLMDNSIQSLQKALNAK